MSGRRGLWGVTLVAILLIQGWIPGQADPATIEAARGCWKERGGEALVRVKDGRITSYRDGRLRIRTLVRSDGDRLLLRSEGQLEEWEFSCNGKTLRLMHGSEIREYEPSARASEALDLSPWPLGTAAAIPADRVHQIQGEIASRLEKDQKARKAPNATDDSPATRAVDVDNTEYLKTLVSQIGWIDKERFGTQTACDATILAKHGGDIRLGLAIAAQVEKDLAGDPETADILAVFYDGLQIALGNKQRYGSQINLDKHGNPMVLPLEDPARVEELRKTIGMTPLSEYLPLASQVLFDGKTIRMPGADE